MSSILPVPTEEPIAPLSPLVEADFRRGRGAINSRTRPRLFGDGSAIESSSLRFIPSGTGAPHTIRACSPDELLVQSVVSLRPSSAKRPAVRNVDEWGPVDAHSDDSVSPGDVDTLARHRTAPAPRALPADALTLTEGRATSSRPRTSKSKADKRAASAAATSRPKTAAARIVVGDTPDLVVVPLTADARGAAVRPATTKARPGTARRTASAVRPSTAAPRSATLGAYDGETSDDGAPHAATAASTATKTKTKAGPGKTSKSAKRSTARTASRPATETAPRGNATMEVGSDISSLTDDASRPPTLRNASRPPMGASRPGTAPAPRGHWTADESTHSAAAAQMAPSDDDDAGYRGLAATGARPQRPQTADAPPTYTHRADATGNFTTVSAITQGGYTHGGYTQRAESVAAESPSRGPTVSVHARGRLVATDRYPGSDRVGGLLVTPIVTSLPTHSVVSATGVTRARPRSAPPGGRATAAFEAEQRVRAAAADGGLIGRGLDALPGRGCGDESFYDWDILGRSARARRLAEVSGGVVPPWVNVDDEAIDADKEFAHKRRKHRRTASAGLAPWAPTLPEAVEMEASVSHVAAPATIPQRERRHYSNPTQNAVHQEVYAAFNRVVDRGEEDDLSPVRGLHSLLKARGRGRGVFLPRDKLVLVPEVGFVGDDKPATISHRRPASAQPQPAPPVFASTAEHQAAAAVEEAAIEASLIAQCVRGRGGPARAREVAKRVTRLREALAVSISAGLGLLSNEAADAAIPDLRAATRARAASGKPRPASRGPPAPSAPVVADTVASLLVGRRDEADPEEEPIVASIYTLPLGRTEGKRLRSLKAPKRRASAADAAAEAAEAATRQLMAMSATCGQPGVSRGQRQVESVRSKWSSSVRTRK